MKKRTDPAEKVVTKSVEISTLVEPKFLTLTERPANQVAFKVVRDDKAEESTMTEKTATPVVEGRKRRIRSTKRSSLLYIEFPEDATDEDVQSAIEEYGLEDYEMTTTADGRKCLRRSDLKETPENAVTVMIGEGRRAGVLRSETAVPDTAGALPHISVIAIDFNSANFTTADAVMEYLQRNDIDFLEGGVENTDQVIRVTRTEVEESTETRRVEIETGVVAVVARAEMMDVPSPFIEVVSEAAYGSWGWGQLDFGAMLADVEFCEVAEDAGYIFRNLVNNILFYSQLPVAVRKELINRAATQYSAYLGSLLDALPAQVVLINRSNLEKRQEQKTMSQTTAAKGAEGQATQRTDDAATAAATAAAAAAAAKDAAPITRSEVQQMITEAVAAAVAAVKPADATQRTDGAPAPAAAPAAKPADTATEALAVISRSMEGITTLLGDVSKRLEGIEGSTTVRSDGGDAATKPAEKDVFAGSLFGSRAKQ